MSDKPANWSRRSILRKGAAVVTAVFLGRLVIGEPATAQDLPRLSEDDPQAKSLNYTHDASSVTSDARKKDAICGNCTHFQINPDSEWGPCAIFPGNRVNRNGWCSNWVAKSG